jgi:hypothetical protein
MRSFLQELRVSHFYSHKSYSTWTLRIQKSVHFRSKLSGISMGISALFPTRVLSPSIVMQSYVTIAPGILWHCPHAERSSCFIWCLLLYLAQSLPHYQEPFVCHRWLPNWFFLGIILLAHLWDCCCSLKLDAGSSSAPWPSVIMKCN